MKSRLVSTAVTLSLLLLPLGCGEPPTGPGDSELDLQTFIVRLQEAGAEVILAGPIPGPVFLAGGHVLTVNGHRVGAYVYESAQKARSAAAGISPDGSSIREDGRATHIEWVDAPHFFNAGRLIVLYVGRDTGVLSRLVRILGPQIAGR